MLLIFRGKSSGCGINWGSKCEEGFAALIYVHAPD